MSNFEYANPSNQNREEEPQRERHLTIELSDRDHLIKMRPPIDESSMSDSLKEKLWKARRIAKDTKVVDLRKKDEKNKSKSIAKKPKKVHTKSN